MTTRRGSNFPVKIGSAVIKRAQDFSADMDKGGQNYYEMGNKSSVGTEYDNPQYSASLSWNPIDNQVEEALGGKEANAAVTLKDIYDNTAPVIKGPTDGLNGARLTGLTYACQVGGEFNASADFRGTGYNDGESALAGGAISGVPVYKSKSVVVVMGSTRAVRCAGFTARMQGQVEDDYELSSEDPFDTDQENPEITCDIQWYIQDLTAGNVEPAPTAPIDIIISVGGTAKKIVLKNMVFVKKGVKGSVKGKVTRSYTYRSNGDATTYGLEIKADNTAPTAGTVGSAPNGTAAVGASVTFTLTGMSDTDGIFKVEFYDGTTKIGTDLAATPYSCTWTASGLGAHSITAKVHDIYGAVATTVAHSFTVTAP